MTEFQEQGDRNARQAGLLGSLSIARPTCPPRALSPVAQEIANKAGQGGERMKAMSDPALTPTDEDLGHAGLHAAEYRPYVASKYHDAFDAALPVQIEATRRMSD